MLAPALQHLARTIQESCSRRAPVASVPTWTAIDQALRGLPRAAIHEWFADFPALTPILHLVRQTPASPHAPTGPIVWIGRHIWPYPPVCPDLLDRSIFIDAKDLSERAWATDVSLRCPALAAVIADGSAFTMSITRRLQLAAAEGSTLGLILRPPQELRQLSAAHTRWTVTPAQSPTSPRWTLRLLRCKGTKLPDTTTWTLELNHETGALDLVSNAADRSVPPQEIDSPRRIPAVTA